MSLFGLFNIGRSAINASQIGLNVTSHNIANVSTPGFSKQDAILSIQTPSQTGQGFLGNGVIVTDIRRSYDMFLQSQILGQNHSLGSNTVLYNYLSQLAEIFNEQEDTGLFNALQDYFDAWDDVSANPDSESSRTILLQYAENMIDSFQTIENSLLSLSDSVVDDLTSTVESINTIASSIADLNSQIAQVEAGGHQANDLRDDRDALLESLSELINYDYFYDENGNVTIIIGQKNLVEASNANSLDVNVAFDGSISITIDSVDITDRITSGKVEGLLSSNEMVDDFLKDIRKLMASIIVETNLLHQSGYGLDSSTGLDFFNSLALSSRDYSSGAGVTSANITDYSLLTLSEYEIRFTAPNAYEVYDIDTGSLVTSGAYVSGGTISFEGIEVVISDDAGGPQTGDTFIISPLDTAIQNAGLAVTDTDQIAASSTLAGIPGDNQNALDIVTLYTNGVAELGGHSYSDYYSAIVIEAGTVSSTAEDSYSLDQALMDDLQSRKESVSGVSLDEEAINLIKYQTAYEAGAKIITITEELLETLLAL